MKKYYLALGLFVVILLSYQNCSDPNLIAFPVAQKVDCLDASKNLTIVDTRNVNSDVIIGGSAQIDFAVYERDSGGTLKAFMPQDPETTWPPQWSKNDVAALPNELLPMNGVDGVLFRTTLNQTSCEENLIQASIALCGGSLPLERNFFVGSCPRECDEHGVTARVGEFRDFYATSTAACGESCEKITRECLPTGRYGPGLDTSQNPITPVPNPSDYTNPTCTQSACPTPTATPGGGTPPPPVDCNPQDVPGTVRRDLSIATPFVGMFYGGALSHFLVGDGQGASIRLNTHIETSVLNNIGRIETGHENTSIGGDFYTSISRCPGDFSRHLPAARCFAPPGIAFTRAYAIGSAAQALRPDACPLEPGVTYYWNISFADTPATPGAFCETAQCDMTVGNHN